MTTNRGKRAERIQRGNEAAQMIYAVLRALPKPSEALTALCSVQALLCIQCSPKDKELDEHQIRAMMANMTDNVVRLILGENDGAGIEAIGLSEETEPRRDN